MSKPILSNNTSNLTASTDSEFVALTMKEPVLFLSGPLLGSCPTVANLIRINIPKCDPTYWQAGKFSFVKLINTLRVPSKHSNAK